MESVVACCSQCDHSLALLLNIWTQIGKSYVSPIIQDHDDFDVKSEGAIRRGENGTIVDNCRVQEVVCGHCQSTLGSKCISSTVNHVLHEGQLLLRISSILIKDPESNDIRKPFIMRVLKLKNSPVNKPQCSGNDRQDDNRSNSINADYSSGPTSSGNPELGRILDDIHTQGEEIERLDKAGHHIVASFNQAVSRINEDVRKLKAEMEKTSGSFSNNNNKTNSLANDLMSIETEIRDMKKSVQSSVTRDDLEQEILSIKTAFTKTNESLLQEFTDIWKEQQKRVIALESNLDSARRDMKELQVLLEDSWATANSASSAANLKDEEIVALKAELHCVKEELAFERSHRLATIDPVLGPQEMDILTNSITKIGQQVSQVEILRMEFDLLKSRVQRMEAHPLTSKTEVTADHQEQEPPSFRSVRSKRKASSISMLLPDTNDDHDILLGSPTTSSGILDSSPSAKAPKTAEGANPHRPIKSGSTNLPMVTGRGSGQVARKAKR